MNREAQIVRAFVDGDRGGHLAGVVLEAGSLTPSRKQATAAEIGLSGTAFVSPSSTAAFRLELFTPTHQIAQCGHATIAAVWLLRQLGRLADGRNTLETMEGRRQVLVEGSRVLLQQKAPSYTNLLPGSGVFPLVWKSLGIGPRRAIDGLLPCVVNTGSAYLVVPLREDSDVASLQPDLNLIARVSEELDVIGFYVFTPRSQLPDRDAGARLFAPRQGVAEEPATCLAAGPLACFLHDKMLVSKTRFTIEQGHWMPEPSPSRIDVRLDLQDGRITEVLTGGRAQTVRVLEIAS